MRLDGAMKGLTNVGNSCYLNAALQCMFHVPALANYVLGGWADKDLFKKRINACAFAQEYTRLVNEYWKTQEPKVLDTTGVWGCLTKVHKSFANGNPHDAHEAWVVMMKCLHDAWSRTPRIQPSPAEEHVDKGAWEAHIAKDGYSILTELFVGQMERIVDDGKEYRSTTYEHFQGLSLDIAGCTSVFQAVSKAFAPETVEGYTMEDGTVATVTLTKRLVYSPAVLVLHLKRFDDSGDKVDRYIQYSTTLDVPGQGRYELFAVCFHRHSHYVAACEVLGQWHAMDDHTVTLLDINTVVNKDAYLLMYKKRLE